MDEASNNPTCSSGQQRTSHQRPFFYVQPPSQPYFLYQPWQLNPYSQALPAGFNFAPRPCMMPYPYMQYPSFMLPQAPMYMMDQRRMFEPRFHVPCGVDAPRHQHPPQAPGRRETACSEVQTDPSDAIAKLLECLDKIRVNELQQSVTARDRELDSGVASQSSRFFSPEEEKKNAVEGRVSSHGSCPHDPVMPFGNHGASLASYESSQMALERQGCWSGELEEEPPIDSSSIHEEACPDLEQSATEERFIFFQKDEVPDVPSDVLATEPNVSKCDTEESQASQSFASSQPEQQEAKNSERVSEAELLGASFNEAKSDHSYQILRLPLESICDVRPYNAASPYYYNYLSVQKTTHERMSVLSPSLDEMSSRDEMFSTDLDDVDVFPKHALQGKSMSQDVEGVEEQKKAWSQGSKRRLCACCGKRLPKAMSRSKVHSYQDEAADSDSDGGYEQPDLARKHPTPRRPQSLPARHTAKPLYRAAPYEEPTNPTTNQQICLHELNQAEGETTEMDSSDLQCGSCQDRLCRNEPTITEHQGSSITRRRQATPLPRQDAVPQWKVMSHRPRDADLQEYDQPSSTIWERIPKTRGEPR